MRVLITLCTIFVLAYGKPEGYFQQHYQYKKSSSTFKNNELQTKNDDAGYYSKQGDLDGQARAKVDQGNERSEFVHPSVDGMGHTVTTYNDRDLTSEAETAFNRHNLNPGSGPGYKSYSSYSSYNSNGQGGYSSKPTTYRIQSNLGQICDNVEEELSRQIQEAVSKSSYTSYSTSQNLRYLEEELKTNLTRQLQEALDRQYGTQRQRGSFSYTISSGGSYSPQANYENQELVDLRKQIESNLLTKLRNEMKTYSERKYQQSSSQSSYSPAYRDSAEVEDLNNSNRGYTEVPIRNYYPRTTQYPERITEKRPNDYGTTGYSSGSSYSGFSSYGSQTKPTYSQPVPTQQRIIIQPTVSVTDIATDIQNDLYKYINDELNSYEQSLSGTVYTYTNTRPNFQAKLEDLKRDLISNITSQFYDTLQKNYGRQVVRDGYSFSSGSTSNANYRTEDFENLKKQVQDNLVKHLETSFKQQEESYYSRKQSSSTSYSNLGTKYVQHGPAYTQSLTDENAGNNGYYYRPSGFHVPSNSQSSQSSSAYSSTAYNQASAGRNYPSSKNHLQDVRNEVLRDIGQEVQYAILPMHSQYSQAEINRLTEELRRNLTMKLEESLRSHYGTQNTRNGYSYSISASGTLNPKANYNSQDLQSLTQQLQADLERQLNEQIRQHSQSSYTASQSSSYKPSRYVSGQSQYDEQAAYGTGQTSSYSSGYSASSSSSHVKGAKQYGAQYVNDQPRQDWMQGDQPYSHTDVGLGQVQLEIDYNDDAQQVQDLGQLQMQNPYAGQQTIDYEDLTQNVEDFDQHTFHQTDDVFGKLELGNTTVMSTTEKSQVHFNSYQPLRLADAHGKQYNRGDQVDEEGQRAISFEDESKLNNHRYSQLQSRNHYNQFPSQEMTQKVVSTPLQVANNQGLNYNQHIEEGQQTIDYDDEQQMYQHVDTETKPVHLFDSDHYIQLQIGSQVNKDAKERLLVNIAHNPLQVVANQGSNYNRNVEEPTTLRYDEQKLTQQNAQTLHKQTDLHDHNQMLDDGQQSIDFEDGQRPNAFGKFAEQELGQQQMDYEDFPQENSRYTDQESYSQLQIGQAPQKFVHDNLMHQQQFEDSHLAVAPSQSRPHKPSYGQQMVDYTQEIYNNKHRVNKPSYGVGEQMVDLTHEIEINNQQRLNGHSYFGDSMEDDQQQQQVQEEDFSTFKNSGSMNLSEVNRANISQAQYQGAPGYNQFEQRPAVQETNRFTNPSSLQYGNSRNTNHFQQVQFDDEHQMQTQYANIVQNQVPAKSSYGNSGYHYGVSKQFKVEQTQELDEQKVEEQQQKVVEVPKTYNNKLPHVETEEVSPEPPQEGFWKRVGGSISNTFSAAKQKAKGLAEKLNIV